MLKSIKGVEIFSVGTWNGDTVTEAHLDEMVRGFKETGKTFRPALKFGHTEKQKLIQEDGMPAIGWVGHLYRNGKKLLADFIDIPDKVYQLLKRGAYKRVSSEVFWNARVGESHYTHLLGAVALLGADMPGVQNLSDIFQMYASDTGDLKYYDLEAKSFTIEIDRVDLQQGAQGMTDQEKELAAKLEAEQKKNHTLVTDQAAKDKELADLKKYRTEQEAKAVENEKALADARLETEVTSLVSEKLVTPAMRPYVKELLATEKKEYSFGEGKDAKKFSKTGLLKEILKLHSATQKAVNLEEGSVDNEVENEVTDSEKALHEKIEKFAKDNKVSYRAAYVAVQAEQSAADEDEDGDDEQA